MKLAELDKGPWQKITFHSRWVIDTPEVPGCYVIANIYDEILYIGKTNDIRQRMLDHLKDPSKSYVRSVGNSSWFFYKRIPLDKLYQTEQRLIAFYKFKEGALPPLNRIGG